MVKQTVKKYEARDVFQDFKDDTYESLQQALGNDLKQIEMQEVCNFETNDIKQTEDKVRMMFETIKKIFTYLQVKSKRFPKIDKYTLHEYFIKPAEIHFRPHGKDFDIIFIEAVFDKNEENVHATQRGLSRAGFTEFILRTSKYLFSQTDRNTHGELVDRPYDKDNLTDVRVFLALGLMENSFKRW